MAFQELIDDIPEIKSVTAWDKFILLNAALCLIIQSHNHHIKVIKNLYQSMNA